MRCIAVILVCLSLLLSGCAEHAYIQSNPSAAKVFINEQFIGLTPVDYSVARGAVQKNYTYRIEKEGFRPESGVLRGKVAPGRIVAAVFTFCITCAFRGFQYFPELDVALIREGTTAAGEPKGTITDRLQRLDEAHDKGQLSEREYRRMRSEILKDF